MIPLCGYCICIHCVYFLSFSARFFPLFGIQYIIYLLNSEYNKMNNLGLLIKIIELTGLTVLIIFAIQGGGEKNHFSFDRVLNPSYEINVYVHKDACGYLAVSSLNTDSNGLKVAIYFLSQYFTTTLNKFCYKGPR